MGSRHRKVARRNLKVEVEVYQTRSEWYNDGDLWGKPFKIKQLTKDIATLQFYGQSLYKQPNTMAINLHSSFMDNLRKLSKLERKIYLGL